MEQEGFQTNYLEYTVKHLWESRMKSPRHMPNFEILKEVFALYAKLDCLFCQAEESLI